MSSPLNCFLSEIFVVSLAISTISRHWVRSVFYAGRMGKKKFVCQASFKSFELFSALLRALEHVLYSKHDLVKWINKQNIPAITLCIALCWLRWLSIRKRNFRHPEEQQTSEPIEWQLLPLLSSDDFSSSECHQMSHLRGYENVSTPVIFCNGRRRSKQRRL